ncbi:hypothetical protein [Myxococcus sp. CA056]|uniref:hypothetical protein n=1 Tax=Myxococcus sp. CA056 TaxID=2741740 RepID=UPI001C2DD408|nr:hypothetical protein [Myxococcus sp. CA056]
MSERNRTGAVVPESRPSEGDLRRRLEGRVELIESALRRYRMLDRTLDSRGWRRTLQDEPSLIQDVLEVEPTLLEALERTERRGEQEGWPEGSSIPKTASRVREVRERLTMRVRDALLTRGLVTESLSLEAKLRELKEVCAQEVSLQRTPTEPFALRIASVGRAPQYVVAFVFVLAALGLGVGILWLLLLGSTGVALVGGTLALVALLMGTVTLLRMKAPGVVWLTPERVVWMPPGDEPPVAVRLDSLEEGGLQLEDGGGALSLRGDHFIRLTRFDGASADRLRVLMELFRDARVRAQAARVDRRVELLTFSALLRRKGTWSSGQAVLLGRGVFFLPDPDAGAALLHAATGRRLLSSVELECVLDGLCWQPESELDAYLVRATVATGGAAWSSQDARVARDIPLEQEVHITRGEEVLVGNVGLAQRELAYRLVHAWSEGLQDSNEDVQPKLSSGS